MKKKYNLKLAVVKRLFRVWLPQLVVALPVWIAVVKDMDLPENYIWVPVVLTFVASSATALDKLFRGLKAY